MAPPKDRREAKARMKSEKSKERQQTMDALRGGDERRYPAARPGEGPAPGPQLGRWASQHRRVLLAGGDFGTGAAVLADPRSAAGVDGRAAGFYVLITVDTGLSLLGLRRALAREVPETSERRGALAYAFGRSIQSRKRRLPVPKVERGWTRQYTKGEVKAFT